jgi:hypothetical protein
MLIRHAPGNCLFASLADQLYGSPSKHAEIRGRVVDHMRSFRPLFEHYVHPDDVQQRRTLRSAATASRRGSEDAFEAYLTRMSNGGTYGGEPELVAFCQVYDQDVTVHLPRIRNFDKDSLSYTNTFREGSPTSAPLHICYGGDEVTRAHYDSARTRDGSMPRHANSPLHKAQDPAATPPLSSASNIVSNRTIRGDRADLSSEFIQDFLQKSKRETENNLEQLGDKARARSPSVTSSQRSASSKRSLDDDDEEPIRSSKRADRRKSTRRRARVNITVTAADEEPSPPATISSTSSTPPSTQDSDILSAAPTVDHTGTTTKATQPLAAKNATDNNADVVARPVQLRPQTPARFAINLVTNKAPSESPSSRVMSVTERPKPTLRA